MTGLRRHRWIHVRADAREAVAGQCRDEASGQAVRRCLALGWPLVARARATGDRADFHPAGLCLPLAEGRRRIATEVHPAQVAGVEEPAPLEVVAGVLPPQARAVAHELAALARTLGFTARAFGSAAWQWRTGEAYLTPASDLDLLAPARAAGLARWLEHLAAHEARSPLRLDGEIEDETGDAVNWREWVAAPASVLVKSPAGARLVARAALAEAWR